MYAKCIHFNHKHEYKYLFKLLPIGVVVARENIVEQLLDFVGRQRVNVLPNTNEFSIQTNNQILDIPKKVVCLLKLYTYNRLVVVRVDDFRRDELLLHHLHYPAESQLHDAVEHLRRR